MVLLKIKQKDEENKTIKVFTLKIKDKYLRPKKNDVSELQKN